MASLAPAAASDVPRPDRALKGFRRVGLAPCERRRVEIELRGRDVAHWNTERGVWDLESGILELCVGTSSRLVDLKLRR